MNKQSALVLILISLMITSSSSISTVQFSRAQTGTQVSGIINVNTTWTKVNSPYTLSGPVAVNTGVTLILEPGVTVNLGNYYIQVNSTLVAKGTSTNQIYLNGNNSTGIVFTNVSTAWNEETGSGSIIQNAVLTSAGLSIANSPKLTNNSIGGITINDGSPIISNNTITIGITITGGSPSILNNNITSVGAGSIYIGGGSPTIYHNTLAGGIEERGFAVGEPVISQNTIKGGINIDSRGGPITISSNIITGNDFAVIKVFGISSTIVNNSIMGVGDTMGIYTSGVYALISDNSISGCTTAISSGNAAIERNAIYNNSGTGIVAGQGNETIEQNLVFNNGGSGISFSAGSTGTIQDNTIANNSVGIYISSSSAVLKYNNIQNNIQNSLCLSGVPQNLDATYNWWGTTDTQMINQSIYDFKNDFNLGTVTFTPFLTTPNPNAPTIPVTTPTPTPLSTPTLTSTSTPSPSPTIPEFPSWIILLLIIGTLVFVLMLKKRVKA